MTRILVVDDLAILREPIAASLRLAGYETHCACDGLEALTVLQTMRPDLILLDLSMPKMDGLSLLRRIRSEPNHTDIPIVLLTAISDKKRIVEAAKMKIQGYLLKSAFSMRQLLEQVKKHASADQPSGSSGQKSESGETRKSSAPQFPSASSIPQPQATRDNESPQPLSPPVLLSREECVRRAEQALQAKALSGVVMQVIALAASPRSDAVQLTSLIARDPMLSARVLKAANSANYASSRGMVTTIPDAVRNIGCEAVRNIAAAMGIFDSMPETTADGFNPIRCWQHSFAVAQLCEQLTIAANPADGGVAYLVGLCHDLGEILLRSTFAAEYAQVLEIQQATGRARHELEREMLGMSHSDLVTTILGCLGLPDSIRVPIETFNSAGRGKPLGSGAHPLAKILRIANLYANGLLLASSGASRVMPLTVAECRAATGQEAPACPDGVQFRCQILSLTGSLARLSAQEEVEFMKPLYPAAPIKLWIAHDPGYSSFNPIIAALKSLAEIDVHDRLPIEPREWGDHQGLVVVSRSSSSPGFSGPEIAKAVALRGRDNVRTLRLSAKIDVASNSESPAPLPLPVPLDQLADFLKTAETR